MKDLVLSVFDSPDMKEEALLGIPAVPSSSGIDQMIFGIMPLIEQYEISDDVFAVNMDSTASNTWRWSGSATLLQEKIDSALV